MVNTPVNLLAPMFLSKSTDENRGQLINLYLNQDAYSGKYQVVAYSTPGAGAPFTTIASPLRAMYTEHGVTYAVGGNKLYSVSSTGISTSLGTLNSSTGWCKIKGINEGLFILDVANGYTYTFASSTLTNLQSASHINTIAVTNGGNGYSNGANITVNDPTGSSATATASVVAGIVTAINVTAAGTNYTSPTVTITPPGTGATATANLTTSLVPIDFLSLTNGGSGYTNPTIVISDSTGTGAIATLGLVPNSGIIQSITLVNSNIPASSPAGQSFNLSIVDGNSGPGTGATLTYTQQISGANYILTSVTLTNGGSNYKNPLIKVTYNGGSNFTDSSKAYVKCTIPANSGILQANTLMLINPGSGYTNPTITVNDSHGSAGTVTGTLASNTISSITVNTGGSNYGTVAPTIVISDNTGTGTIATASLSGGAVSSIAVNTHGKNYTSPIVTITPLGSGATATASLASNSFPTAVCDIECQDEVGITIESNSQVLSSSAAEDLTSWPALNFGTTTGQQNINVALVSFQRQLYILGDSKSEVWWNAGTTPFQFQRVANTYIECGCVSPATVCTNTVSIFFLGQTISGGIQVYQLTGYTPAIISQQINYIINTYAVTNDCYAFMYTQEGEEFYCLTFPTQGITWCVSLLTQQWHSRQSLIGTSLGQWFPSCYSYNYNKHLVGDSQSGNIYELSTSQYTENGSPITRTLVTHPYYTNGEAVTCHRLQVDFDQTPGITLNVVNLYVSRDGGYTFGAAKPAFPVQTSDGEWRCYWPRLGRARTWVFKIETTINDKYIILGAWGTFSAENSSDEVSP